MLKSIFYGVLLFFLTCNLSANDETCKGVIKKFWEANTFAKPYVTKYLTDDYISISPDGKQNTRKDYENYIRNFSQYRNLVRKKQYAEAAEIIKKLLEQEGAKIVKKDNRKFAQLSAEEKKQTIKFMNESLKPNKYLIQKNQTMQITNFSNNGSNAVAIITYKNPINQIESIEITLEKINGQWLVKKTEKKTK